MLGSEVLPEVVYAYGLKEAIEKGYLKKVVLHGYSTTRTNEFVEVAVEDFSNESSELRPRACCRSSPSLPPPSRN